MKLREALMRTECTYDRVGAAQPFTGSLSAFALCKTHGEFHISNPKVDIEGQDTPLAHPLVIKVERSGFTRIYRLPDMILLFFREGRVNISLAA